MFDRLARWFVILLFMYVGWWGLYLVANPGRVLNIFWMEWPRLGLIIENLGAELAGIVIGVATLDLLNERRQKKEWKERLIIHMGSPTNEAALEAVRELRYVKWLMDGSLRDANLEDANLINAKLKNADLRGAYLVNAKLNNADFRGARLNYADFRGARLNYADFRNAILVNADFAGADLTGADFRNAILVGVTRFSGAILNDVDFTGAKIMNVGDFFSNLMDTTKVLINTTMPDGRKFEEWEAEQNDARLLAMMKSGDDALEEFDQSTVIEDPDEDIEEEPSVDSDPDDDATD